MGYHLCRPAGVLPGKIIKAHLRNIQHYADLGGARQNIQFWQDNFGSLTRQPGIHAGVGQFDLHETQSVGPRYIRKRVFVFGMDFLNNAYQRSTRMLQRKGNRRPGRA